MSELTIIGKRPEDYGFVTDSGWSNRFGHPLLPNDSNGHVFAEYEGGWSPTMRFEEDVVRCIGADDPEYYETWQPAALLALRALANRGDFIAATLAARIQYDLENPQT